MSASVKKKKSAFPAAMTKNIFNAIHAALKDWKVILLIRYNPFSQPAFSGAAAFIRLTFQGFREYSN